MRSLKQLMDISGRKALVTGGVGHIGLAVEEALIELGVDLAISDIDASGCEERSEILSRIGAKSVIAIQADLTDEAATRRMVNAAIDKMDGLDILIHCAAYGGSARMPGWVVPFEQQTLKAWDAAMRVNLSSAFVLVQQAKDALTASGHGAVVFIASIYGMVGPDFGIYEDTTMANPLAYGASKGGLLQLVRYLATLLAPRVRVNAISPGGVWRQQPEAFHTRYKARTPLQRMATEEDLKGAIGYLASDLSSYVTGHNLVVDGGWTVW